MTGAKVLYFYLRQDDPERNNFVALARSMIHQAYSHDPGLLPYLYNEAVASTDIHLRSASIAQRLLDCCIKALENTYIVVDGLDEAPQLEQRPIVGWVRQLVDSLSDKPESCRCVFFSQDDQHTRPLLSAFPTLLIKAEDTQSDIGTYARNRVLSIGQRFALPDSEAFHIATEITNRANGLWVSFHALWTRTLIVIGMFLFARVVLDSLCAQTNQQSLYDELLPTNFPTGLLDAYLPLMTHMASLRHD